MDQIEQDMARFKQPAMAVAGGVAAALVVATLPHVYLENIVGAVGLSEIIPAAAPPLGNTARGLIALLTGMVSTSALYLFLNHKPKFPRGGSNMSLAIRKNLTTDAIDDVGEGKSRFTAPKLNLSMKSLTKLLKKPKKSAGQVTDLKDLPDIKPSDRHPDAPVRQPIFASSDLGAPLAEKIRRFDEPEVEHDLAEPVDETAQFDEAPAAFEADKISHSPPQEEKAPVRTEAIARQEIGDSSSEDLTGLSLAQLADRLEAGIRRLEALEALEVSGEREKMEPSASVQPLPTVENTVSATEVPEPVAPTVTPPLRSVDSVEMDAQNDRQADMDLALKAALGTLERMAVQR